jgi:oxygen-dependent protoporphyrinogen oxidase
MEELPQKLGSFLSEEIFCNQTVKKISRNANDWNIDIQMQSGEIYTETFDQIISTIPSHKILSLKWENIKGIEELDTLASSKHFPLALVYLGFKKEDVNHPLDGFGFLVPEVERLNILGTLFSSTLFPGRAPDGQVLLTTFVGGERNPELAKLPVQKLVNLVQNELSKVLGINAKPCFQEVKLWPQAIPLPDLEMGNRKNAAEKLSKLNPGLSFSGSYLSGASLPNCLEAS